MGKNLLAEKRGGQKPPVRVNSNRVVEPQKESASPKSPKSPNSNQDPQQTGYNEHLAMMARGLRENSIVTRKARVASSSTPTDAPSPSM